VSIFSRIDPQSLSLTRKLLEGQSPSLSHALPTHTQSRYPLGETTIELDIETVNNIIKELTTIGNRWLADENNECYEERKKIMAYLIKQWIRIGEDTMQISHLKHHSSFETRI
jgi:hypothetical protein